MCVGVWLTLFVCMVNIEKSQMVTIDMSKSHFSFICLLLGFSGSDKYLRNWDDSNSNDSTLPCATNSIVY